MSFFINKDNSQLGPLTEAQVLEKLKTGELSHEHHCWREGWPDWRPLSSVFPPTTGHTPPPFAKKSLHAEQGSASSGVTSRVADEVKSFFKNDFKDLLITFFTRPVDGLDQIFSDDTEKAFKSALIISGTVYAVYVVGLKVIGGELIDVGAALKNAFLPLLFMAVITGIAFGIKSISGKPNIKRELITGALCGIPLTLMLLIVFFLKIFFLPDEDDLTVLLMGDFRIFEKIGYAMLVGFVLFYYALLMLINVFHQSLKAAGTNDAIAWYLSPISIFAAFYISGKILSFVS